MNNKTKPTHSGHRKRLRELIDKVGLKSLSNIQLVEQILTMTHSRKDTNKLAHLLLDKFGSLSKILDAKPQELMQVEGIGKTTAQMISYLPQISEIYYKDKIKQCKIYPCSNYADVFNFFEPLFNTSKTECVYIGFVNKNNYFENYEKLSDGDISSVGLDNKKLAESIVLNKPNKIFVAHNHPFGSALPSCKDYDAHARICNLITTLGYKLGDDIIMDKKGFYSHNFNGYIQIKKED